MDLRQRVLGFALGTLLILTGCKAHQKQFVLQREWTANAEFAGDVWASTLARQHGLDLQVREGSEVIDPIKMVRSGAAQFGIASSDRVLKENAQGADLLILAASSYRSPVVFLTQPSLKISTPAEFINKKVGIQPGTNTDLVFQALIATVPLSKKQMVVVDSGWSLTNFESKSLDVIGAFDYDEPVQLDLKGIPYGMIEPEKFGVHFVGTVYFTSRDQATRDPQLVQQFMNYLVEGWREALAHPSEAIHQVATEFHGMDEKKELLSLNRGSKYFGGEDGKLLYASPERWNAMGKQLIALGQLNDFSFARNVDYQFLDNALGQKRGPDAH